MSNQNLHNKDKLDDAAFCFKYVFLISFVVDDDDDGRLCAGWANSNDNQTNRTHAKPLTLSKGTLRDCEEPFGTWRALWERRGDVAALEAKIWTIIQSQFC